MIDSGFLNGTSETVTVGKTHMQLECMIVAYRMYLKVASGLSWQ